MLKTYFNPFILFVFFVSAFWGQSIQKNQTVAVLDFEGQGVSKEEVQTLTERLRTEIGNTDHVRLIERKAVEKIMAEQGFQQSGCTSDECAAEVGQLLGVQYMIGGSIGKMGKSYTIDAKIFSVETGETIQTKNATHKGDISGLLTEMEIMAWEIIGLQAPQKLKLKRAGSEATKTVAVLDFEGRGITLQEAQTLTDRFATALSGTKKVILVERGTVVDVLEEQGFETGDCTSDECAAEIGAMLGVESMVSGAIGKLGNTYTIDAKMFSVATGAAENMKSITYSGMVDGLITEIEILAWEILDLKPPRKLLVRRAGGSPAVAAGPKYKTRGGATIRSLFLPGFGQIYGGRKIMGFGILVAESALIGMAVKSNSDYISAETIYNTKLSEYQSATEPDKISLLKIDVNTARSDMTSASDQLVMFSAAAGGLWLLNTLHALIVAPKDDMVHKTNYRLAYDHKTKSPQLRWEISL